MLRRKSHELAKSGEVPAGSHSPFLASLLHPSSRPQAPSHHILLLVVSSFSFSVYVCTYTCMYQFFVLFYFFVGFYGFVFIWYYWGCEYNGVLVLCLWGFRFDSNGRGFEDFIGVLSWGIF